MRMTCHYYAILKGEKVVLRRIFNSALALILLAVKTIFSPFVGSNINFKC